MVILPPIHIPDIHTISQQAQSTSVSGGSSASVHVTNIVNANSTGGSASVHIETEVDGQKSVQDTQKDFGPGEEVSIDIATSTSHGGSSASSHTEVFAQASASVRATSSKSSNKKRIRDIKGYVSSSTATTSRAGVDLEVPKSPRLKNFLGRFFGFFGFSW